MGGIFDEDEIVLLGDVVEVVLVIDEAKCMLHDDGAGALGDFALGDVAGREEFGVDIDVAWFKPTRENRIDGGDAGIGGGEDFAGTEGVLDGSKNHFEAKTGLETEKPIVGVGTGKLGDTATDFETGVDKTHKLIIHQATAIHLARNIVE